MSAAARRSRLVLTLLLVGAAAIATVFAVRFLIGGDGQPVAVATPSAPASAAPTAQPPEQPTAFKIKITNTKSQTMGNGRIYGRAKGTRTKAVRTASRAAVKELARHLTHEFVRPKTRFTAAPARRLLSWRAEDVLRRRQRSALGVGAPDIDGGRTGRAKARTIVLHDGREVFAVTVKYDARMKVDVGRGKRRLLRQRGSMVFVPTKSGWRAEMVDVTLRLPQRGKK